MLDLVRCKPCREGLGLPEVGTCSLLVTAAASRSTWGLLGVTVLCTWALKAKVSLW